MDILCKFRVDSVTHQEGGSHVKMSAVTSGSPENDEFWEFTPSGNFEISVTNEALKEVKPGQEYFINVMLDESK